MSDSPIVAFYRGTGTDHAGRHLDDVLAWDDDALEAVHDYIQWVFPNELPSRANFVAPLLTPDDMTAFRHDPDLRATLRRSFERILRFYGFLRVDDGTGIRVEQSPDWEAHSRRWLQPYNHNHLRLTRIMKCLHRLGLEADARALQQALLDLAEGTHVRSVSRSTVRHWRTALEQ